MIGDAASFIGEDGKPLPMIAPVAMQQATVAAKNIVRMVEGKPLEKFSYRDPGVMATIGRNQAVAHMWGINSRLYRLAHVAGSPYHSTDWFPQPVGRSDRLGVGVHLLRACEPHSLDPLT